LTKGGTPFAEKPTRPKWARTSCAGLTVLWGVQEKSRYQPNRAKEKGDPWEKPTKTHVTAKGKKGTTWLARNDEGQETKGLKAGK